MFFKKRKGGCYIDEQRKGGHRRFKWLIVGIALYAKIGP